MRCAYIDIYGVCLEPDGCEMQHGNMSTSASTFTPQLSTASASFNPNFTTEYSPFTPGASFTPDDYGYAQQSEYEETNDLEC